MKAKEAQFKNFLLYIHKCFREDYDRQMEANYTGLKTVAHPLNGDTVEERLSDVYKRIHLNTQRLQDLLDDLNKRLGKGKKGEP